ncbi:MAG TPA: hypothetical protein VFK38_08605 [Candidatus Limnocylindrales bacterium]|nr:hypothetical protein [Candidatus Limnocylindrales bacterium]
MEMLVAPLLALLLVGLALRAAHGGAGVMEQAFGGWFSGYRPDPWPRGVQEEDAPRFRLDAPSTTDATPGTGKPFPRPDPGWSGGTAVIEPAASPCPSTRPAGRARVHSRLI